jgi:Mg2+ and Co2+ transporter CorA
MPHFEGEQMNFIKSYLYSKKLKAEAIEKTQKNIGMIHSVLVAALAADKDEADSCEARHLELIGRLRVNDEQMVRQIFELKESLDNFLQSQAGMNNIIKKFFKMEIDNAMAESVVEKEEPTEHDKRF